MDENTFEHGSPCGKSLAVLPVMNIQTALDRYQSMVAFVRSVLREGVDFGVLPGTDKPTLLKPGAERLCSFFGLAPKFRVVERIEDWTGRDYDSEPFIHYWYKCMLFQSGQFVGEGDGSCNSRESKYRWRWVRETELPESVEKSELATRRGTLVEFQFAIDRAETSGQYGKPLAYWQKFSDAIQTGRARRIVKTTRNGKAMEAWEVDNTVYRVPSDDVASQANTILKMAQKRALIAATLITVNASEFFTQDIEDLVGSEAVVDSVVRRSGTTMAAAANAPDVVREPTVPPRQLTASEEKPAAAGRIAA